MSPLDALEEGDIEFLRDVGEAGDFVGARAFGEELAAARPERFFHLWMVESACAWLGKMAGVKRGLWGFEGIVRLETQPLKTVSAASSSYAT